MVMGLLYCGTKSSRFLSVVEDFGGWGVMSPLTSFQRRLESTVVKSGPQPPLG